MLLMTWDAFFRGNNSEHFEFRSEVFDVNERYTKTNIFIAVLGIDIDDVT